MEQLRLDGRDISDRDGGFGGQQHLTAQGKRSSCRPVVRIKAVSTVYMRLPSQITLLVHAMLSVLSVRGARLPCAIDEPSEQPWQSSTAP